eukprot:gnl/TRDRNA2_/TRDRNA2_199492_c0_seq1.p1 gnl/TRDRNA2_/TRDRNA2_199492_c0~~gnl/TRDRNA2_/TRDRNA2_199492_c0_seq1.p1  ORF type:complete len:233 (-),score=28.81 gnl/TRDRNA2_/TRDRNA2_199492_c0_seq1:251-949(-)
MGFIGVLHLLAFVTHAQEELPELKPDDWHPPADREPDEADGTWRLMRILLNRPPHAYGTRVYKTPGPPAGKLCWIEPGSPEYGKGRLYEGGSPPRFPPEKYPLVMATPKAGDPPVTHSLLSQDVPLWSILEDGTNVYTFPGGHQEHILPDGFKYKIFPPLTPVDDSMPLRGPNLDYAKKMRPGPTELIRAPEAVNAACILLGLVLSRGVAFAVLWFRHDASSQHRELFLAAV